MLAIAGRRKTSVKAARTSTSSTMPASSETITPSPPICTIPVGIKYAGENMGPDTTGADAGIVVGRDAGAEAGPVRAVEV